MRAETVAPAQPPAPGRSRTRLAWLGLAPFLAFALLFLIVPTALLMAGAFTDRDGHLTLANLGRLLARPDLLASFGLSLRIGAASAVLGAALGLLLALAVASPHLPRPVRAVASTFAGVASQFAGVPLAFAFLATLGRVGLVTMLLRDLVGFNLYATGFTLLGFWGLTLTYLYFQIPLMMLIILPALDGLKPEWREATLILGGSPRHYWTRVALPMLWPSVLGAAFLLFANAFGAVATAYALTGSSLSLVTIQLFAQIRGDVLNDPNLGYAIAFGMVAITCASNGAYIWLRGRSERWLR
jgi:putative spermidine/putrescine transport system permease protein